jgi:hypothetical protein
VILVVASIVDEGALALVERFPRGAATLLTPRDLSVGGICVSTRAFSDGILATRHGVVRLDQVTGVLTLLPCIYPEELVHITKENRTYVACEMTAFLSYVLSGLSCPKLNPATATCLSGPNWQQEHRVTLAHRLEIPVAPVIKRSPRLARDEVAQFPVLTLTVVGRDIVGSRDEVLGAYAAGLARAASLDLLRVSFGCQADGTSCFLSATQFVEVMDFEVSAAIVRYFE